MQDKTLNITITSGTIFKAIVIVLAVWALYLVRDVVLIFLTSVVLASAIAPGVHWFMRYRVPRVLAVVLIYLLAFAVLFALSFIFVPPLISELGGLSSALPEYINTVETTDAVSGDIVNAGKELGGDIISTLPLDQLISSVRGMLSGLSSNFFAAASSIFGGALSAVLILVISFYFAVQEKGIEKFVRVVAPLKHEGYIINLWDRTKDKIGKWLQGQLLLAIIIGILVYLGLTIFGVPYATALAALAAVFELIPIFGPILAAVPAVFIAFVSGGPVLGFIVLGLYAIIQQFENHLIYPLVVTKIVGIPPLLVILALLVGGQLAGFLGFLLAVPLATVIVELFDDLEREKKQLHEKEGKGLA